MPGVAELALPSLADVMPHAGAMRLLDRVLAHAADETVCEVDVGAQTLFRRADGTLPAWVAVEYMAQCVAAHAGLVALASGGPKPELGLFLGSRRVHVRREHFEPDQRLRVRARPVAHSSQGLHAFDCVVEDLSGGPALVEARVNVHVPRDAASLLPPSERPGADR